MNLNLRCAVEDFGGAPMMAGKAMRQMFSDFDHQAILGAAIPLLQSSLDKPGTQYLLTLLLVNDLILAPLTDPTVFSFDQAIGIARQLVKIEPLLDIKMVRRILDSSFIPNGLSKSVDNTAGVRLLEIMAAISDGTRIVPVMSQLLRHSNPKIRSKAALLVGRTHKNCKWVEQRLGESDPRVRANAVESLWGVESAEARTVFWAASGDPDNRVAGNALMGLYRLGDVASIPFIVDLVGDARPDFRVTGVWLMGETGDPRFLSVLARMISDSDTQVRALVFRAIAKLKQAAAKCPVDPQLVIHLTPSTAESGLWREVQAAIWKQSSDGGQPVTALRPTQFALYEDSQLVTQYEVQENTRTECLSIAFALPRVAERDHPFHVQCEAAFQAAVTHKRHCDSWLILKYLTERERATPAVPQGGKRVTPAVPHGGTRIFHIDDVEAPTISDATLPADVCFHTAPEAILSAVEAPGTRMLLPTSSVEAIQAVVTPLSHCRGSRHAVLLCQPDTPAADWERWREIAAAALSARINVHVMAFARHPELVQLSAGAGGTFTLLDSPEGFAAALEGLCASLVHSYSIRFCTTAKDESAVLSTLKVRVSRPGGFGEESLRSSPSHRCSGKDGGSLDSMGVSMALTG